MLLRFVRNRTSTVIVMYSLYLYFRGLSLRNTSKSLEPFKGQNRSYVAVWEWIQRFGSSNVYNKHRRVSAFIIDETKLFRLVNNIFGCGSVLNPFTDLCLE